MEKLKALLHVDEPDKWELALNNANNLLEDRGEAEVIVEILANGPAVNVFGCSRVVNGACEKLIRQMESLAARNVRFSVCRNALRANSIAEESLPGFITVVPTGITELLLKQENGFFYIKP